MKTSLFKVCFAGATILATCLSAKSEIVYDNSTTDSGYSLGFTNGWNIGNEIILGNSLAGATITNFSFEIYSPQTSFVGSDVQMEVYLLANDGIPFNGYLTPGTVLWDSQLFSLETPYQGTFGSSYATSLDFSDLDVPVASTNFTFAAVVTGLDASDVVGFELFTPESGSVGQSYGDYWVNDGTGWTLETQSVPTTIGAVFEGTAAVPEPTTLALAGLGALLLIGVSRQRRSCQSK